MTSRGPLLSAAIIARDEERFIGDCLASLAPLAGEIVVVDTGSCDATVAIAREAGARVHEHRWDGNFSTARNRSLDLVTGEWVLYIDCDEQVVADRTDRDEVLRLLSTSHETVAFRVLFAAMVASTPYREYRIWRNRPDIRFRGVIHETIVPDILRISGDEGSAIEPIPLMLQHYGYEGDQAHKHERNLPLLLTQLEHDPRRVYLWWHLGIVRAGLGDLDGALTSWRRGVAIVREDGWKSQTDLLAYCELAFRLAAAGEPVEDLVSEGLAFDAECHTLAAAALVAAMREGRADDVERLAAQLLAAGQAGVQSDTLSYPETIFSTLPWQALAESRWDRGDVLAAAAAYDALVRVEPDNLEYRAKAAASRAAARAAPTR